MPDPIPSCFRGVAGGGPPASTAAGPNLTSSVYETPLGLAALSWSRTVLGLLVRADLRLSLDDDDDLDQDRPLTFKIRPWLFFARRGSKRFHHQSHSIDFAWDLTRAKFPASGGPEPAGGFFLSIAVDGEIILIAGDLDDLAFKKMKLKKRELSTAPISRREHVTMKDDRCYKTQARFGGKERSISIDLSDELCLEVDGKRILQIRTLRWKFRGSEKVQLAGGDRIQLSWDVHNWLFQPKDGGGGGNEDGGRSFTGNAVFVFRFESEETEQEHFGKKGEGYFGKEGAYKGTLRGYFGKTRNWSESSSGGGGGGGENGKKKSKNNNNKKKSLLKTRSSSSSSSASSAGSSTVMEWASPEENELRSKEGFSLLVYAWKS